MFELRKSKQRGHAEHGWLDSYHSFSFAEYYDPAFMGFRVLRVINEDRVAGGRGFPTHPHRDMEIITYVIEGALEHRDTLGTNSVILPGEVQRMSAGTGIEHSEFNQRKDQPTHLLQIWLLPDTPNIKPSYGQKSFASALAEKNFVLTASPDGRNGSLQIHQDVDLYVGKTPANIGFERSFEFRNSGGYGWIQVIRGELGVGDLALQPGDGLAISNEKTVHLKAVGAVEFLLFDLP